MCALRECVRPCFIPPLLPPQSEFVPPSFDASAVSGTPDVQDGLGWQELDAQVFVVYSVDIAWTDMNFTYTGAGEGTWDPETHQYSGSSEGAWTASDDSITVTNHSNAAVKATASYQAETGYESTTMTFGNNEATVATAVGTEVDSAPSATITVTPGGTLAESANGGKIGTITVSIAAAE